MKINKKSWHYRWSNFFTNQNTYNANLCSYFWKLMFSLFMPMFCIFIIGVGIVLFFIGLFTDPVFINILLLTFCAIGCVSLPPITIHWFRIWTNHVEYRVSGEKVFIDFVKAKKRKICPLIEFYYS